MSLKDNIFLTKWFFYLKDFVTIYITIYFLNILKLKTDEYFHYNV